MGSTNPQGHIVIAGIEPWGHARPLCAFASQVAITRAVHVTLITTTRVYERVKTEVSRGFEPKDAERQGLVRVLALDTICPPNANHAETMRLELQRYVVSFTSAYEQLANGKPVKCAATDLDLPAVPAPKLLVIDFMLGNLIQIAQGIDKGYAKPIGFCSGMASFLNLSFAPVERGGRPNFRVQAHAEAEKTGKPILDVADELFHTYTDEVIRTPGLPSMYHWEYDPQETSFMTRGLLGGIWLSLQDTFEACKGMILTSPKVYEPKAIEAMQDWFAETSRGVWAIGPLLPLMTSQHAIAGEGSLSSNAMDISTFMDGVLKSHGEHSMLYISFGSGFWPSEQDKLEAFIDIVIERKIPFILSHGSPMAHLSDSFREKVEASGVGLLSPWSPQQTILAHPALGWFVCHCGHNSTVEALSSGVPLICWPFHADQPANAVNVTENHNAGYELIEVRTGNGLKPRYRTGKAPVGTLDAVRAEAREVLEKAFGSDGAKKRANAQKLQKEILASWDKGGVAEKDMRRFLDLLDV